jgi:GAF domain-containing protein
MREDKQARSEQTAGPTPTTGVWLVSLSAAGVLILVVVGLFGLWLGGWEVGRVWLVGAAVLGALGGTEFLLYRALYGPIMRVVEFARRTESEEAPGRVPVHSHYEAGTLARAINELLDDRDELQTELTAQNSVIEQILARQKAARALFSALDDLAAAFDGVETFAEQAVDEIQGYMGLGFVGLYLHSDDRRDAVLLAGTGVEGSTLVASEHRAQVGVGTVGICLALGRAEVARRAGAGADGDKASAPAYELPAEHIEVAVPLRSRGVVLGALDVQIAASEPIDHTMLDLLQDVADHVALAIDGARLGSERQSTQRRLEETRWEAQRDEWREIVSDATIVGVEAGATGVKSLDPIPPDRWSPMLQEAWRGTQPVVSRPQGSDAHSVFRIALPIPGRERVLGVLDVTRQAGHGDWAPAELRALGILAEELGQALEGASSQESTKRRMAQQSAAAEVSQRLHTAPDVDTMLQTAARELQALLNLDVAEVRVGPIVVEGRELIPPVGEEESDDA